MLELDEEETEEETKEARKLELSDGFSEEELELLVKNEILTLENLADLATDELTEIFEIDEERAAYSRIVSTLLMYLNLNNLIF